MRDIDFDALIGSGKTPAQDELLPSGFREKYQLGKIFQLGFVVPSVVEAARRLEAKGVGPFMFADTDLRSWIERGERKSFSGKQATAIMGEYEIELLEAGIGTTIYADKIRSDGKLALHHLGFLDHRFEFRVRQFNDAGVETYAACEIKSGPLTVSIALMDSEKAAGIYIEFIGHKLFGWPIKPNLALMRAAERTARRLGFVNFSYGNK